MKSKCSFIDYSLDKRGMTCNICVLRSLNIPVVDSEFAAKIQSGLVEVETLLASYIKGGYPLVVETSRHLVEARGNQFLPILALIASHFGQGQNQKVTEAAVVCEPTHMATLYDDDVIDIASDAMPSRKTPGIDLK